MAGAGEQLRRAQGLYDAGALSEAEAILTAVVRETPRNSQALLLLGAIAVRSNSPAAVSWLERARDAAPKSVDAWKGLGLVYRQQGRLDESIAAYERALALDARDAETHVNIAVALRARRDPGRAIDHLKRAIALSPGLSPAYLNLGNCLLDRNELEQAGAAYTQCLKLDPRSTAAIVGLSKVFQAQRRPELAEKVLRSAAKLMPDNAEVLAHLGLLVVDTGQDDEATAILDAAIAMAPRNPVVLHHAGTAKQGWRKWDEAERLYRRALEVEPDDVDTLLALWATLANAGKSGEARAVLDRANTLYPTAPKVRFACALAHLSDGELSKGWVDYPYLRVLERRWMRFCHLPPLERLELGNRKVVIWGDQGVGDEIIYGSFLADLSDHADNLVCEIDPRLVPLFSRGMPQLTFVGRTYDPDVAPSASDDEKARVWRGAKLDPRFQGATHQIALPDLGRWLRPDFASFPRHSGYLRADPGRVAEFRRALNKRPGERIVGLSWRSLTGRVGRSKSLPLDMLVKSLSSENVRFVSLQYGDVAEEIGAAAGATGRPIEIVPDLDYFKDIEGLAALIMACDAVVTVSNVTAHLAGALGQKTAVLCSAGPSKIWYWFREGELSPWYPSVRIFRETNDRGWADALAGCGQWLKSEPSSDFNTINSIS